MSEPQRSENSQPADPRPDEATPAAGPADPFALAYDRLRAVARAAMAVERDEHTLQPTALVHEAYLRMVEQSRAVYRDRDHFVAVAARVMRRLLIDHARARGRDKRGGNAQRLMLEDVCRIGGGDRVAVLDLEQALSALEAAHPEHAAVVELRFFGGMTSAEAARALQLSERTVERHWRFARAWLFEQLNGPIDTPDAASQPPRDCDHAEQSADPSASEPSP